MSLPRRATMNDMQPDKSVLGGPPKRRWIRRPEGSNWGEFGDDDQMGSLNYIGCEQRRHAASLVRTGENFCLSLPLDFPGGNVLSPHRNPPRMASTIRNGQRYFNFAFCDEVPGVSEVGSDDVVTLSTQYSTQWDSFAHVGHLFDANDDGIPEPLYYNGFRARVDILPPELRTNDPSMPLGIDGFAARPIQGRGVMIDLEKYFGRDSRTVDFDALRVVLDADKVEIRPGDILCFHTGFADELLAMGGQPDPKRVTTMCAALEGRDDRILDWLTESRIAAVAADNYAVERLGRSAAGRDCMMPLHRHCLFKRGIPLGELWYMTELAAWLRTHGRTDFLLTAPALRLRGGVGSPLTPVATV